MSESPPPPQPVYILRGHAAQIHAVEFMNANTRIITGDADGWVVVWDTGSRRPVAVWRAHEGAVLKVGELRDGVVTHGRDNRIFVWKLDEKLGLDTVLPVEEFEGQRRNPWLIASMEVNALNFCGFGMCQDRPGDVEGKDEVENGTFFAVPSALNSDAIDIMRIPGKVRVYSSVAAQGIKTGMAMSISLLYVNGILTLMAGYESGHAIVFQMQSNGAFTTIYTHKAHSQPVLSLAVSPEPETSSYFLTTSADAVIAKHPLVPLSTSISAPIKTINTKHAGQQSVCIRNDNKIFATAGWDSRVRVYSVKTMKEVAVLKWHKEGCYAVAFGEVICSGGREEGEVEGGEQKGDGREIMRVDERRNEKVRGTHWLAAGAKDGKVSLWEVF
ncbi:Astra associated protein 1 Asa1 [Rhizina undulata]